MAVFFLQERQGSAGLSKMFLRLNCSVALSASGFAGEFPDRRFATAIVSKT